MNNVRTIYLDWYNGSFRATGGSQLAYQYDHLSNLVIFENAPKLDNYYLIVEMKETEDGEVRTFEPIQLAGSFWLVPNSYTQLAQNISFQVCCKTENGDFERHSAQFTGTILPSKDHAGAELDVDPSIMFDPYKQWVSDIAMAAGAIVIDPTLSVQGAAADAKAVGDALDGLNERLDGLGDGVPTEVRQALLTLFQSAAYAETGLTDEVAVIASWAAVVTAISLNQSSISISGANTSQLVATTTPTGGAVSWASSDTSVATVSSSGLVTGVGNGTATITASCGGKKATCSVTVSGFASLTGITATYTQSGTVYNTDTLDSLKAGLVVTATYSDSTTRTLSDSDYVLSGTLSTGTSTITVTYGGETATFNVTVTDINALNITYAQGSIGSGNSDANRVSCVIMSDVHFDDGETVVVTFPEGYQIFPFSATANSNKSAAGTRSGTNSLYAYIVSDSGYVTPTNQGANGSLLVNGGSLKQWVTTSPATYSFTKTGEYGCTYTGIGFAVKKTDESNITPSDIQQVVTIEKVEV